MHGFRAHEGKSRGTSTELCYSLNTWPGAGTQRSEALGSNWLLRPSIACAQVDRQARHLELAA